MQITRTATGQYRMPREDKYTPSRILTLRWNGTTAVMAGGKYGEHTVHTTNLAEVKAHWTGYVQNNAGHRKAVPTMHVRIVDDAPGKYSFRASNGSTQRAIFRATSRPEAAAKAADLLPGFRFLTLVDARRPGDEIAIDPHGAATLEERIAEVPFPIEVSI